MDYGLNNFLLQSCFICVVKFCYPLSFLAAISKSIIYMVNKMKIITLSANTSWYLYNFRKSTITRFIEEGYKVICISPKDEHTNNLINLGCEWFNLKMNNKGSNPFSDIKIIFRLLTHKDEIDINAEIQALNRLTKGDNVSQDVTTRLRYMIQDVGGNEDRAYINNFVKNSLLARDSRALRKYIQEFTPDLDLTFNFTSDVTGEQEALDIPFGIGFFYPSE